LIEEVKDDAMSPTFGSHTHDPNPISTQPLPNTYPTHIQYLPDPYLSTPPIVVEWAKGMLHPWDGDRHP